MRRELTAGQAVDLMVAGERVIDPDGDESRLDGGEWVVSSSRMQGQDVACSGSTIADMLLRKGWKRKPVTDADLVKKWRAQAVAFQQSAELCRRSTVASPVDYCSELAKSKIYELLADELEKRGEP